MLREQFLKLVPKLAFEHRAKRHMQHLAGVFLVQEPGELLIGNLARVGNARRIRRKMVGGPVLGETLERKPDDPAEQVRGKAGRYLQGHEVARARGLHVPHPLPLPGKHRIQAELVRAGVEADPIWPDHLGDGHMSAEVASEHLQAPPVIHRLLHGPAKPGGEAGKLHPPLLQLFYHEVVLDRGGGTFRLIQRKLKIKSPLKHVGNGPVHLGGKLYSGAVLDSRGGELPLRKPNPPQPLDRDVPPQVRLRQALGLREGTEAGQKFVLGEPLHRLHQVGGIASEKRIPKPGRLHGILHPL